MSPPNNRVVPEFLTLSAALVQRLPMRTRRWSRSERDRWLAAYMAAVDLHYEIDPDLISSRSCTLYVGHDGPHRDEYSV